MKVLAGWLLMFAGIAALVVGIIDMVRWADSPFGWFRVATSGAVAGAFLAPGALMSQGIGLEHRIAWVQATAITAVVSGLVMGWVGGMAVGGRLGWPMWLVHTGFGVGVVAITAASVWYGVKQSQAIALRRAEEQRMDEKGNVP